MFHEQLLLQQECGSTTDGAVDIVSPDERQEDEHRHIQRLPNSDGHIPTDMSDTTESEAEKTQLVVFVCFFLAW